MSAVAPESNVRSALGGAVVTSAAVYPVETRRSSRLLLAIPVELTVRDAGGELRRECTRTLFLNKHGARLRTRRRHPAGAELGVRIPHLERARKARVVWSAPDSDDGLYETAIELAEAENFWGVQFPPDDWVAPQSDKLEAAGSAVESRAPSAPDGDEVGFLPQDIPSAQQSGTVNATLNALICLLEKKNVFRRAELAELMERFS